MLPVDTAPSTSTGFVTRAGIRCQLSKHVPSDVQTPHTVGQCEAFSHPLQPEDKLKLQAGNEECRA